MNQLKYNVKAMKKEQVTIIAAAGHGTRCFPVSTVIPKEMFPVKNKPVIHYLVEEAKKLKAKEIIIVISKSKKMIGDYVNKYLSEHNVKIVTQKEPKGLLNVLNCFRFNDHQIINLVLGDELIMFSDENIKKINQLKHNNLILTQTHIANNRKRRYGMFEIRNKTIIRFQEKPQDNLDSYTHAAIGRYFFKGSDLNRSKYKNENDLQVFIKDLVKLKKLNVFEIRDLRCDVSIPEELAKANR